MKLPNRKAFLAGGWRQHVTIEEAVRSQYVLVYGKQPEDAAMGKGMYDYLYNSIPLHSIFIKQGLPKPIDPPPPIDPPTKHGMVHKLERPNTGRIISYGPSDDWWFGSRWFRFSDARIRKHFQHKDQAGMQFVWLALSTGTRPEMRETVFHGLKNKQLLHDKIGLVLEEGRQPVFEGATQEYMFEVLKKDPNAIADYLEEVGQEFMVGNCRLAFPFREIHDMRWSGIPNKTRMKRYSVILQGLERGVRGADPEITIGVHTGGKEVPSISLFDKLPRCTWLMQWNFKTPVDKPYKGERDDHSPHTYKNAADWFGYWSKNRMGYLGGRMRGTISFEHSLPYNVPFGNWGSGQTLEEAEARGSHFLKVKQCLLDMSGGARG